MKIMKPNTQLYILVHLIKLILEELLWAKWMIQFTSHQTLMAMYQPIATKKPEMKTSLNRTISTASRHNTILSSPNHAKACRSTKSWDWKWDTTHPPSTNIPQIKTMNINPITINKSRCSCSIKISLLWIIFKTLRDHKKIYH